MTCWGDFDRGDLERGECERGECERGECEPNTMGKHSKNHTEETQFGPFRDVKIHRQGRIFPFRETCFLSKVRTKEMSEDAAVLATLHASNWLPVGC